GYQADAGAGWWGKLYEELGRALLWEAPGDQHVKKGEWNLYEILAVGHHVRTAINGHPCVDLQDPEGALQGLVAFQLHSGGPMEVRFRRLNLEVDPEPKLTTTE
ncbi:MAG: family 16 glycoside hydrolase, partial [Verrucomicrobiota bacterium]|nr:family 16 glycoside hydrolase [Verrucomicrobiota bacterium]